jgi:hypothetical protein
LIAQKQAAEQKLRADDLEQQLAEWKAKTSVPVQVQQMPSTATKPAMGALAGNKSKLLKIAY